MGREAEQPHTTSVEAYKTWIYASTPFRLGPYSSLEDSSHGVQFSLVLEQCLVNHRDNFTLHFTCNMYD
jgi:hypothetical protein